LKRDSENDNRPIVILGSKRAGSGTSEKIVSDFGDFKTEPKN